MVTDGDLRRAILHGRSITDLVCTVMNAKPCIATEDLNSRQLLALMQSKSVSQIPVLNSHSQVVALKLLKDLLSTKESDHPVVIMAGGLGKRLRPFTATCPKPLLKVQQRPILEIMLQRFISYGFKDFYFAVNYKAQMIEEYFADGKKWDVRISYLREQKALGTAGALSLLPATLKHSALVINGDVMTQLNFSESTYLSSAATSNNNYLYSATSAYCTLWRGAYCREPINKY